MKKLVGTRIRKLRESQDLTQENMAVELDITAGAYAKIERGETDPSVTRLKQIADILKVDLTYFFKENIPAFNMVEEPQARYGNYVSREDFEHAFRQVHAKIEKLEAQIEEMNTRSGAKG